MKKKIKGGKKKREKLLKLPKIGMTGGGNA